MLYRLWHTAFCAQYSTAVFRFIPNYNVNQKRRQNKWLKLRWKKAKVSNWVERNTWILCERNHQKGTHSNFVKLAELQGAISVDRRSDVFTIITALDGFQLPHAAHVR